MEDFHVVMPQANARQYLDLFVFDHDLDVSLPSYAFTAKRSARTALIVEANTEILPRDTYLFELFSPGVRFMRFLHRHTSARLTNIIAGNVYAFIPKRLVDYYVNIGKFYRGHPPVGSGAYELVDFTPEVPALHQVYLTQKCWSSLFDFQHLRRSQYALAHDFKGEPPVAFTVHYAHDKRLRAYAGVDEALTVFVGNGWIDIIL